MRSSSSVINIYYEDGNVFAYSGGHLFCLDARTGDIKWDNGLTGYGYGPCIMASESQSSAAVNQIVSQQAAASTIVTASASSNSGGDGGS